MTFSIYDGAALSSAAGARTTHSSPDVWKCSDHQRCCKYLVKIKTCNSVRSSSSQHAMCAPPPGSVTALCDHSPHIRRGMSDLQIGIIRVERADTAGQSDNTTLGSAGHFKSLCSIHKGLQCTAVHPVMSAVCTGRPGCSAANCDHHQI